MERSQQILRSLGYQAQSIHDILRSQNIDVSPHGRGLVASINGRTVPVSHLSSSGIMNSRKHGIHMDIPWEEGLTTRIGFHHDGYGKQMYTGRPMHTYSVHTATPAYRSVEGKGIRHYGVHDGGKYLEHLSEGQFSEMVDHHITNVQKNLSDITNNYTDKDQQQMLRRQAPNISGRGAAIASAEWRNGKLYRTHQGFAPVGNSGISTDIVEIH